MFRVSGLCTVVFRRERRSQRLARRAQLSHRQGRRQRKNNNIIHAHALSGGFSLLSGGFHCCFFLRHPKPDIIDSVYCFAGWRQEGETRQSFLRARRRSKIVLGKENNNNIDKDCVFFKNK